MADKREDDLMDYLDIMKGEKMIKKELLPYVDFVERNDIETVWRIHIKKNICAGK